jgi:hypothetical protein
MNQIVNQPLLDNQQRLAMKASHRAATLGMNQIFIDSWKAAKTPEERKPIEEKQDAFILGYTPPTSW